MQVDCLGLSSGISSQFTLEMYVSAKNCNKIPKIRVFGGRGGQGRSRSSMLINLKSLSQVLVMISSMPV